MHLIIFIKYVVKVLAFFYCIQTRYRLLGFERQHLCSTPKKHKNIFFFNVLYRITIFIFNNRFHEMHTCNTGNHFTHL